MLKFGGGYALACFVFASGADLAICASQVPQRRPAERSRRRHNGCLPLRGECEAALLVRSNVILSSLTRHKQYAKHHLIRVCVPSAREALKQTSIDYLAQLAALRALLVKSTENRASALSPVPIFCAPRRRVFDRLNPTTVIGILSPTLGKHPNASTRAITTTTTTPPTPPTLAHRQREIPARPLREGHPLYQLKPCSNTALRPRKGSKYPTISAAHGKIVIV